MCFILEYYSFHCINIGSYYFCSLVTTSTTIECDYAVTGKNGGEFILVVWQTGLKPPNLNPPILPRTRNDL